MRALLVLLLCLLGKLQPLSSVVVTKDIADEKLENVDGIIQETEGITVEEYTDDGNTPNPPPADDAGGKRTNGRRQTLRRDSTVAPLGSLHDLAINPEALSITSFIFNPTQTYSPWVEHMLGSKAVHHNRSSGHSPLFRDPLSAAEVKARTSLFRRAFVLPPEAVAPSCSIEVLGFARLDVDYPIKENVKHGNTPSLGSSQPASVFLFSSLLLSSDPSFSLSLPFSVTPTLSFSLSFCLSRSRRRGRARDRQGKHHLALLLPRRVRELALRVGEDEAQLLDRALLLSLAHASQGLRGGA